MAPAGIKHERLRDRYPDGLNQIIIVVLEEKGRKMHNNSLIRKVSVGFLTAVLLAGMLFSVTAEETEQAAKDDGTLISIGSKESEEDYEVTLKNESGKEIKAIALRASYEEYSGNLLPENVTLKDQEEGTLWCHQAEMINFVPPVYDIRLTFSDDSESVLHTLPFGDADSLTIQTEEESGIAYVSFFSLSLNADTDSLQSEKNIRQSGEEQLIADYRSRTGQTSSQEAPAAQESAQTAPAEEAPAPAVDSSQQCLDNGLMF